MPKVGNKHFEYTEQGQEDAIEYARETGEEVIPTYDAGGRVERMQGYDKGGKVTKKHVAKRTMAKKEAKYRMKKLKERSSSSDLGKPGHVTKGAKARREREIKIAKFMEGKRQRKAKSWSKIGKTRAKIKKRAPKN